MRRLIRALFILLLLPAVLLSGCLVKPVAEKPRPGEPAISPNPQEGTMEVTLYFTDDMGMEVIPEERKIPKDGSPEKLIVTELLKGPADDLLYETWPKDLVPFSVETIGGITYVNMPRETRSKISEHNGEILAVESLVRSLTDLPGVRAVQILIEGRKEQTLCGKYPIFEPIYRGIKTGNLYFSSHRFQKLQAKVDAGEETWRLDPLEVARRDGRSAGFCINDEFIEPAQQEPGRFSVEAIHDGMAYVIELEQPLGRGEGKIWAVKHVKALFTPIRPVNYQEGERFIYGTIAGIDRDKRVLKIKREYPAIPDLKNENGPEVALATDAVIHVKRITGKDEHGNSKYKEIDGSLDELREGMRIEMILTADKYARAVTATP